MVVIAISVVAQPLGGTLGGISLNRIGAVLVAAGGISDIFHSFESSAGRFCQQFLPGRKPNQMAKTVVFGLLYCLFLLLFDIRVDPKS